METILVSTDQYCPYCDSDNIESDWADYATDGVFLHHHCNNCGKKFTFNYWVTSVDIKIEEGEE